MKRLTACFGGTVQGVGFRMTAERLARRLPVTGYVRNLDDGKVEVVAEGKTAELHAFIASIRESALGPYIRSVDTAWGEATGEFRVFDIRA